MNGPLEWIAAVGTMIAAALVAADLGRKVTGAGFVLFCAVALMWVVSGLTTDALPIAAMNAILLLINAWGVAIPAQPQEEEGHRPRREGGGTDRTPGRG